MSNEDERIEFYASFPDIQSAIKTGRDGSRIQLDIPASELPSIVRLVALQHQAKLLKVTIEAVDSDQVEESLGKNGSPTPTTGTARRPTDLAGR